MTDDLIERAEKALDEFAKDSRIFGLAFAKDYMADAARTLLPEAVEEIKRLEAKLAVVATALEWYARHCDPSDTPQECPSSGVNCCMTARAALAEIKGEKE